MENQVKISLVRVLDPPTSYYANMMVSVEQAKQVHFAMRYTQNGELKKAYRETVARNMKMAHKWRNRLEVYLMDDHGQGFVSFDPVREEFIQEFPLMETADPISLFYGEGEVPAGSVPVDVQKVLANGSTITATFVLDEGNFMELIDPPAGSHEWGQRLIDMGMISAWDHKEAARLTSSMGEDLPLGKRIAGDPTRAWRLLQPLIQKWRS